MHATDIICQSRRNGHGVEEIDHGDVHHHPTSDAPATSRQFVCVYVCCLGWSQLAII